MDEEFIFQVTEEELSYFPEEQITENTEAIEQGDKNKEELIKEQSLPDTIPENTPIQNKVNIPALLDLKLPRLYAASRNGKHSRQNKEQGQSRGQCRRPRGECRARNSTSRRYRWGLTPERRGRALGCILHEADAIRYKGAIEVILTNGHSNGRHERQNRKMQD